MHFFVYIVCFSLAHFHDDKKQRYIDCATFQLWKFCKHALIGFDLIMSEIYIPKSEIVYMIRFVLSLKSFLEIISAKNHTVKN